jgi:hypothetical protein
MLQSNQEKEIVDYDNVDSMMVFSGIAHKQRG